VITKQQAIEANEFHFDECRKYIGSRGGVTRSTLRFRRNGRTQTWKTRPDHFRVPVKRGLREYDHIVQTEAYLWHTAEDCKPTVRRVRRA
jgi:hypothetical protein